MNRARALFVKTPDECVQLIIERVGPDLRVATPLAVGKPNQLLNALYQRVKQDSSLSLTLYTALTLEKPKGRSDLERRFVEPMAARLFADYPDLDYEVDRVNGRLPSNVKVIEFYFPAGKFMENRHAQQDYISANYTHVARDLLDRGVNVLCQMVAIRQASDGSADVSLGSNPDVAVDLMTAMRSSGRPVAFAAQVNGQMPFMYGDALKSADDFDFVVEDSRWDFPLFAPPKTSVPEAEFAVGAYCSALVRDGGELQVGIGALGDAVVYSLLLRHQRNEEYCRFLRDLGVFDKFGPLIDRLGGAESFSEGLFGASEMVVDGFYHLFKAGVIKRKVYDDLPLQRLMNEKLITEMVTPETLVHLVARRAVHVRLTFEDTRYLKQWGVFHERVKWNDGHLELVNGDRRIPNLEDPATRQWVMQYCLGERLKGGAVIHGGFFLGPRSFYEGLHQLTEDERHLIQMRSVRKINQLYGHEELDRLHRKDARFINTCLKVTLLGHVVSDALEDGRVVSGVGGQYNFVSMAHALPDGRSIMNLRSTRGSGSTLQSNLVFKYGHVTIPRHLRDLVVTEYGVADLRGKTDSEVVGALLNVADSRFQEALRREAVRAGKLASDYRIPEVFRQNRPEQYLRVLEHYRHQGLFPPFPFGTDLTEMEIVVGRALKLLKKRLHQPRELAAVFWRGLKVNPQEARYRLPLERMKLAEPRSLKERLYQRLLLGALVGSGR